METPLNPTTTTISVFTRHSPGCPKKNDRNWKRCNCRKALYVYENGQDRIVSAKTRSWEEAERVAQAERDRRDPVRQRLREIEERETQKANHEKDKNITVPDATDRWMRSVKIQTAETSAAYSRAVWRINNWTAEQGIKHVRDITADALDRWRGEWSPTAEKRHSRLGATSQSLFQGRLKQFCRWCMATGNLDRDPAAFLPAIAKGEEKTQPLTADQFQQLLDAIEPYTSSLTTEAGGLAKELRALFLLQRWAGLRILDVLMLPRTALVGNRLSLITKKTGARIEDRTVPECVVKAFEALTPDRPGFLPGYYLWHEGLKWDGLSSKWVKIINDFNRFLSFRDDQGKPMRFKSHMLRDTCAVEMLLVGMPLEDVSKYLTHESIRVTEQHYAPWVKPRLKQLDDKAVAAMRKMGATFGQ